jgi:FdhD protein
VNNRAVVAPVTRLGGAAPRTDQDLVAVEAPLLLTLSHETDRSVRRLGLLMRTPGDDRDLVLGLLHAEGIIRSMADVVSIEAQSTDDAQETVHATLAQSVDVSVLPGERPLPMTSACGLCGRLSVRAVDRRHRSQAPGRFSAAFLASLPAQLRAGQAVFAETGGLHGAALFDAAGERLALAEDVGRHNAVDKVVGALLGDGRLPAGGAALVVSGRAAFEIVQKAVMAGVAALVAVGAPSSLAVDAARAAGLTLVGFARDGGCNIYSGAGAVRLTSSTTADTPPPRSDPRR